MNILLVFTLFLLKHANCNCPKLSCDKSLGDRVCYFHDGQSPSVNIQMSFCKEQNKICDIYNSSSFASVDTVKQYYSPMKRRQANTAYSLVDHKSTIGYCKTVAQLRKNLNAGRTCEYDH